MCCWVRPTSLCTPKRSWNSCLLLSPLNQVLGLQTPQIWVTLQMTASLRKWTTTLHLISSHLWLKKQQWNPWSEDMIYMFYTQNTELSRGEGLIFGREWQKKEIWVTSLWFFFFISVGSRHLFSVTQGQGNFFWIFWKRLEVILGNYFYNLLLSYVWGKNQRFNWLHISLIHCHFDPMSKLLTTFFHPMALTE